MARKACFAIGIVFVAVGLISMLQRLFGPEMVLVPPILIIGIVWLASGVPVNAEKGPSEDYCVPRWILCRCCPYWPHYRSH